MVGLMNMYDTGAQTLIDAQGCASLAYQQADAMLAARDAKGGG